MLCSLLSCALAVFQMFPTTFKRSQIHKLTQGNISLTHTCMWVRPGQNVRPLNKHEYILDVATEAESVDANYSFWFRRVIWTQPLKFDNELCVAMQYNQVRQVVFHIHSAYMYVCVLCNCVCVHIQILPDYRKGLLNVLPHGKVSDQQFHQISKLAALQHRAKDIIFIPSM